MGDVPIIYQTLLRQTILQNQDMHPKAIVTYVQMSQSPTLRARNKIR